MKYIPGYKFTPPSSENKIVGIKKVNTVIRNTDNKPSQLKTFEPGIEYTIFSITPKIDKGAVSSVKYVFKSRRGMIELMFSSIGDAEKKLDNLIGVIDSNDAQLQRDSIRKNLTAFAKTRLRR